jgi:hypothetical protein
LNGQYLFVGGKDVVVTTGLDGFVVVVDTPGVLIINTHPSSTE